MSCPVERRHCIHYSEKKDVEQVRSEGNQSSFSIFYAISNKSVLWFSFSTIGDGVIIENKNPCLGSHSPAGSVVREFLLQYFRKFYSVSHLNSQLYEVES